MTPANHIESVASLAHDHDARHSLAAPVEIACPAANVGSQDNLAHVLDADRRSVLRGENGLFQVGCGAHVTLSANHVLGAAILKQARAGFLIRGPDRLGHFGNRNVVGTQAVGIDIYLVLLDESAHRGDLGHSRHLLQVGLQIPVLIGAELGKAVFA